LEQLLPSTVRSRRAVYCIAFPSSPGFLPGQGCRWRRILAGELQRLARRAGDGGLTYELAPPNLLRTGRVSVVIRWLIHHSWYGPAGGRSSRAGTSYLHETGARPTRFSHVYQYQLVTQVEQMAISSASTTIFMYTYLLRATEFTTAQAYPPSATRSMAQSRLMSAVCKFDFEGVLSDCQLLRLQKELHWEFVGEGEEILRHDASKVVLNVLGGLSPCRELLS
jgi:hypothetical protein